MTATRDRRLTSTPLAGHYITHDHAAAVRAGSGLAEVPADDPRCGCGELLIPRAVMPSNLLGVAHARLGAWEMRLSTGALSLARPYGSLATLPEVASLYNRAARRQTGGAPDPRPHPLILPVRRRPSLPMPAAPGDAACLELRGMTAVP